MYYNWIKIIHIMSAVVLFGISLGSAGYLFFSKYVDGISNRIAILRQVAVVDWVFTAIAGIIQPITGFMLIDEKAYVLKPEWWLITLLGYGFAGACWFPAVYLRGQCESLLIADPVISSKFVRYFNGRLWLSVLAFLLLIIVFYFMTNVAMFEIE